MKRLAIAASVAVALALSTSAGAAGTLVGKYSVKVTKPASLKGTYTLNFKTNGTGTWSLNGRVAARFTFKGSTLTAPGGKHCHTAGTYKIKLVGRKLKFSVLKDTCTTGQRKAVFSHTYTKVG